MSNKTEGGNSFEDRFYRENPTLLEKIKRNCRLLLMLFVAAMAWAFKGYRLRRAIKQAEETGRPLYLEDQFD